MPLLRERTDSSVRKDRQGHAAGVFSGRAKEHLQAKTEGSVEEALRGQEMLPVPTIGKGQAEGGKSIYAETSWICGQEFLTHNGQQQGDR